MTMPRLIGPHDCDSKKNFDTKKFRCRACGRHWDDRVVLYKWREGRWRMTLETVPISGRDRYAPHVEFRYGAETFSENGTVHEEVCADSRFTMKQPTLEQARREGAKAIGLTIKRCAAVRPTKKGGR